MKLHLIAMGQQMPLWVQTAYQDYTKRLPKTCSLVLHELATPKRHKTSVIEQLKAQEAALIMKAIPDSAYTVALDERGTLWSTHTLSEDLRSWQHLGRDIAIIIGGPDGLDQSILDKAQKIRSLSLMTLPHPFVRVMIAEQIYRAWTVLTNHPYHR